jgi:hypothetical protein
MAIPAPSSLSRRLSPALLAAAVLAAAGLTGCDRPAAPITAEPTPTENPLQSDLDDAQRKIATWEKTLAAKDAELKAAAATAEANKAQLAEKDVLAAKKDAQVKSIQAEAERLKKSEALVFASISALQQKGDAAGALARYQQFIKDFPNSPLVANATSAVNELTVATEQEAKARAIAAEPKTRQREFQQQFEEGFLTLQDLAPVLKNKSVPQVLALLGPPNRVFGDGTEIGYVDKAIDPVTGKRGIFIVAFALDKVANIRVEYAGRRVVP